MLKKIIIIVTCLFLVGIIGISTYYNLETEKPSPDALKFKEEYEALNNTVRESDGATYNNISIPENNPIKYLTITEALKVLKEDSGVLYIGANWCPWCRNAIPVLFDTLKETNLKTIYYLNIDNEKDNYEVKDNKLVKTTEGTKEYYELLEVLKNELADYKITSNGKTYDTGEKRIYMPFVTVFKNGKILGNKTGTVSLNDNQTKYDDLTKEQQKELKSIYADLLKKIS